MRSLVLVVAATFGLACTRPNPETCRDNHCNDPALPFCDVDGAIGGEPYTCIAVSCTPGEFAACRSDSALMCGANGDNYDLLACEYGCGESGCNRCNTTECEKHIIPKYLPSICDQLSPNPELTIVTDTTLDTSNDLGCTSIVPQTAGPEICVLHYGTITIERNRTYTVRGARVLALVADRELLVDGILDISASSTSSGPGGGHATSGTGQDNAGGGAGYRTAGGAGATMDLDGGAANGGPAETHPSLLAELFGGTRPLRGTDGNSPGGGGGGVTLISCRGTTSVPGLIDAGGGGGLGDRFVPNPGTYLSSAGGGAGGTVVLQGMAVSVTGELYANGGGGGGGGAGGSAGEDGRRSATSAAGGAANTNSSFGGDGGIGGTTFPPGAGKKPDGAGGGSAGFILVYAPQSTVPLLTPLVVSPGIETTGVIATN